jgi:hypothetical protein
MNKEMRSFVGLILTMQLITNCLLFTIWLAIRAIGN